MYRKMVISSATVTKGPISIRYNVHGAVLLSQNREIRGAYDNAVTVVNPGGAVVFDDAVRVITNAPVGANILYSFIFDVAENQPAEETVSEISVSGVSIIVYNDNGVIVCHNNVSISTESAPTQTGGLGEMTSEPVDETGEMTSEPIDGTGEMKSEHIDGLNTTI